MDPLAIIYASRRQVVFFARADIFRKRTIAKLLYFMKILPIFRIRDGFRSVDKNREMFEEASKVLFNNRAVGLFPEGNHSGKKHLRNFRKGTARLAFQAEENADFQLGLQLVPVGIDYSNYFNAGSDLIVVFGDPISIEPYKKAYLENPPKALAAVTQDLAKSIKRLIIDIEPMEDYRCIYIATETYYEYLLSGKKIKSGLFMGFLVKKDVASMLNYGFKDGDEKIPELRLATSELSDKLSKAGLRLQTIIESPSKLLFLLSESLFLLILFPVFIYGVILNYLPYRLPFYFTKEVKDPHLKISVRFGAGYITYALWYFLIGLTIIFIPLDYSLKALFLISLPVSGLISFYYYRNVLKLLGKLRWFKLKRQNNSEYDQIVSLRDKIIDIVSGAMK
jgi:1-acyl-sn-glycerol-3-phosphate acyltransferase